MKKPALPRQSFVPVQNFRNISRRNFVTSCAACAACISMAPLAFAGTSGAPVNSGRKLNIRILYSLHAAIQPGPDWPNVGFDFNPAMDRINTALAKHFPDFVFIPSMATGAEDAVKITEADNKGSIDGYIVYQMNCWNQVIQTVVGTGKPVLYADFQFAGSGGFLVYNSYYMAEKSGNIGFIASSRMEDLFAAVDCFNIINKGGVAADFGAAVERVRIGSTLAARSYSLKDNAIKTISPAECSKRLKTSKILAVNDQNSRIAEPIMGIPLEYIPFSEINDAWSKADKDESRNIVGHWQKSAAEIIDVPVETLETSAAMYLGMKAVLKNHDANAITVNCLGGFYGGHIHAYPCLGFHELCNEGLVGACECDIRSAATMLTFNTMTNGRPGFISDPVIDTSKRRIIYAHCVAPNRVFGPQGQSNPFMIMTHSEDRQGASVRSLLPVNFLTTTLEIDGGRKEILFHQAVALDNDPDDRACRTKLSSEPLGDMEKLFTMWNKWGWHRVTFYGDLKEPVYAWADAIGWKVIEEG